MHEAPTSPEEKTRPHVVVIHRWRDTYAEYARYVDHHSCAVSYVSTAAGTASVPGDAAGVVVVSRPDDLAEVRAATAALARAHGAPDAVVALKEDDLLVAARLREEWGCPGPRHDDLLLFRDKYLTCCAAQRAGLAVPAFAPVSGPGEVRAFAGEHGWPVVVKPRLSSSSEGVVVVREPAGLDSIGFADGRPRLVQVFDQRPIYHVDGVFAGGGLRHWRASRYLNTCLDFRGGGVLGSVEEDDRGIVETVGRFTERLLRVLARGPVVFHLEVFVAGSGCALLEVAARVGGAEISFLWREVHGLDLMRAAFDIQLARAPGHAGAADTGDVAGWLLVPAPAERPCRIAEVTSMVGRQPGPYAEAVPRSGDVLPGADSYYEDVGGRFRFRGASTREVARAIRRTAADFRMRGTPIGGDVVPARAGA